MKKIIISNTSDILGGNEKWALTMVSSLSNLHYDVIFLVLKNSPLAYAAKELDLKVKEFSSLSPMGNLFSFSKLLFFILKERPQIVLSSKKEEYWMLGLASFIARVPVRLMRLSIIRKLKNNFKYKLIFKLFHHRIIVNSNDVKKSILNSSLNIKEDKIKIIHNGFKPSFFSEEKVCDLKKSLNEKFRLDNTHFLIGSCVNLVYRKRLDLTLKAIALLKDSYPQIRFLIIGDGPEKDNLKKLSFDLEINKQVIFLGHQNNANLYYSIFDLYVLSSDQEGMPVVLLESMQASCPVVATDCGGTAEVIKQGETGILIEKGSEDVIAKWIKKLIKNDQLRLSIAKKGKEFFDSYFTDNHMAQRYDYYFKALEDRCFKN